MKTDNSIDYYALLGIDPNAKDEDIKKAFKKQAFLHHPDRNIGKEEEAKSRFQDVHTAYDILSDKTKRDKYDRDRQRHSNLWERQAPQPSAPASSPSAFQRTRPARPPPRSTTASRYAAFADASTNSFFGPNANSKFDDFKAFESMRGGHRPPFGQGHSQNHPPRPPPRAPPTAQKPPSSKARARSDWDEGPAGRGAPNLSRSQSTRTPRRGGFNPYSTVGDEPSTRNMSAYQSSATRNERAQTAESKFYPPPPPPSASKQSSRPHSMSQGPQRPNIAETLGETYSSDRLSTPYAAKSGERTYFSTAGLERSAKSSSNLDNLGSNDPRRSPGSGRFRSASPRARTPRHSRDDTSPSESEDESYTDRAKSNQQAQSSRRASVDPRGHAPKPTVEDDPNEPASRFSKPSKHHTWAQESPIDGSPVANFPNRQQRESFQHSEPSPRAQHFPKPQPANEFHGNGPILPTSTAANVANATAFERRQAPLYDMPYFSFATQRFPSRSAVYTSPQSTGHSARTKTWPYWAIPSTVAPPSKFINSACRVASSYSEPLLPINEYTRSSCADYNRSLYSFSIPSSSSSSAVPSQKASTENIDTQFSSPDFNGKFSTGASEFPFPSSSRGSPPKRSGARPPQASPPFSHGVAATSVGKSQSQQMPPPKPPPPTHPMSSNNASSSQPKSPVSPSKFSSQEWQDQFKEPNWARPGPPLPPRQISTPRSKSARGAQPKRNVTNHQAAARNNTGEDTGNDGDDEARQSGSNVDTEGEMSRSASASAMDIDTETPPSRNHANTGAPPASGLGSNTTSPANGQAYDKPQEPQTGFNMHQLRNVFPFYGTSSNGLAGMKNDLGSTLPFESAPAPGVGSAPKPQRLELPQPPKPPDKPSHYTLEACEQYMKTFSTYMREFQSFNGRMLDHFNTRHAEIERMTKNSTAAAGKGLMPNTAKWSWMGAKGSDAYNRYMAWLEEDDQVEEHWRVSRELHRTAMKRLGEVRKIMTTLSS